MRLKRLAPLLVIAIALLSAVSADAQSKTLFWRRWDSAIVVQPNSDVAVTEEHEIVFTSGEFRFGVLTIPKQFLDSIVGVRVAERDPTSGNWVDFESTSGGQRPGTFYTLDQGNALEIDYFFLDPPVRNETRLVRVSYTLRGAIRYYEGGDQLWWEAVGALGWPIDSSTVTITLPEGAAPRPGVDPVVSYGTPTTVVVQGNVVTFRAVGRADGKTPLEVRVQFPHGVVAGRPARWQAEFDRDVAYNETTRPLLNLLFGAAGLALMIGGPIAVYALWRARGRDPDIGPVPEYLSEPPSDLPPAVVGTLVDEQADLQDVISTLVDLARRGYLIMEEEKKQGLFTTSTEFTFARTDQPADDLRPYEKLVLERIFGGQKTRTMSSLREKFYTAIPRVQDQLYKEVVREGFFTAEPDNVRALWSGAGAALTVLAIVFGMGVISIIEDTAEALIMIPLGLGVFGVTLAVAGNAMPARTRKGAEQAALWRAFRTYLQRIEQYADVQSVTDQFDRYLPYAIAFGLDRSWIRTFSRVPATPVPPWYVPYGWRRHRAMHYGMGAGAPGGVGEAAGSLADQVARPTQGLQDISDGLAGGLQNVSNGLTNMLNAASRTFTSRPQSASTGSSGSWSRGGGRWSGGGGGFSGGGRGFSGGSSGGGRSGGFG